METARPNLRVGVLSENDPVTVVPGVGPAAAALLERSFGIRTLAELASHYPARYEDRSIQSEIGCVPNGEYAFVRGSVVRASASVLRRGMSLLKVTVRDETEQAELIFFNQARQKPSWQRLIGREISVWGKITRIGKRTEISDVEWEIHDPGKAGFFTGRIVPLYGLTKSLTQGRMRRMQHWLAEKASVVFTDPLPSGLCSRRRLISRSLALSSIHWPEAFGQLDLARRRLAFDEYLVNQLIVALRRSEHDAAPGLACSGGDGAIKELRSLLPYSLTAAQERVASELAADMSGGRPMRRMVQGDVGAGKSVVALYAMLLAARNGYQTAIMAPTEILAEQHHMLFTRFAESLKVSIAFLSGSLKTRERADVLKSMREGSVDITVGTHALFQHDVAFRNLGLVVVDEQHRFGVVQRSALTGKGVRPHLLVMTATPIPRSLTLTVYGDLDISVIDELPPGRRPITTHWKRESERETVYSALRDLLDQGRQAYIVCSRVEGDDAATVKAAVAHQKDLNDRALSGYRVGLMHGQMRAADKQDVMERFRSRKLDVLVATTVVEVGVDVPNASVIVIEDAGRYGLSQLHQLRGRVGRGAAKSYCILIGDPATPSASQRLETIEKSTDGFAIAEEDLKLRGPGDYFGTRQAGAPTTPFMDLKECIALLQEAREEAEILVATKSLQRAVELRRLVDKRQRSLSHFAAN